MTGMFAKDGTFKPSNQGYNGDGQHTNLMLPKVCILWKPCHTVNCC